MTILTTPKSALALSALCALTLTIKHTSTEPDHTPTTPAPAMPLPDVPRPNVVKMACIDYRLAV